MSRYSRMVPQVVRNIIRSSGASKPNWYVGTPATPVRHDPALDRAIAALRIAIAEHADTVRARMRPSERQDPDLDE